MRQEQELNSFDLLEKHFDKLPLEKRQEIEMLFLDENVSDSEWWELVEKIINENIN